MYCKRIYCQEHGGSHTFANPNPTPVRVCVLQDEVEGLVPPRAQTLPSGPQARSEGYAALPEQGYSGLRGR
jgi:hypothetical protein